MLTSISCQGQEAAWAHIVNSLTLVEWIALLQGPCKAGSLRNDLVSTLEAAESPEAEFATVQIKNDSLWPHPSLQSCTILFLMWLSFSKVVSFLWEMSNLVFCVWPGEKELETWLLLGGQTRWKESLCLELQCAGIALLLSRHSGEQEPGARTQRQRAWGMRKNRLLCTVNLLDSWPPYLL